MLAGWWLAPLPAPRQAHHRPGACTAAAWPPLLPTYRGSQSQRRAGALGGSDERTGVPGRCRCELRVHPPPGKHWEKALLRKSVVSDRLQRLLQPKLLK